MICGTFAGLGGVVEMSGDVVSLGGRVTFGIISGQFHHLYLTGALGVPGQILFVNSYLGLADSLVIQPLIDNSIASINPGGGTTPYGVSATLVRLSQTGNSWQIMGSNGLITYAH